MRKSVSCCCAIAMLVGLSGCMTGPSLIEKTDQYSSLEPGSPEWWSQKAMLPSGVRQKCKKGKLWPARPRPAGEPQQFSHTFHAEHYWPLPYVCQDRQYIQDVLEMQTMLGWQEETTLYNRHFNPEDQTLTRPGMLHLERILETTPLRRRNVFVEATYDPGIDAVRLSNTETVIAELTYGRETLPVSLRDCREFGRPAAEVKILNDLYNGTFPTPRLGGASGGGSGGGSSSGAAAPAPTP